MPFGRRNITANAQPAPQEETCPQVYVASCFPTAEHNIPGLCHNAECGSSPTPQWLDFYRKFYGLFFNYQHLMFADDGKEQRGPANGEPLGWQKMPMFYSGAVSQVQCFSCAAAHASVECPHCGVLFLTPAASLSAKCPAKICGQTGPVVEWQEKRARSFAQVREGHDSAVTQLPEKQEVCLIMQYFSHKDPARKQEIDECLKQNVLNPHIHQVHVLTEEELDLSEFGSLLNSQPGKIVQHVIAKWLTYRTAIEYAERELRGKICVLANADIHFDETLKSLQHLDMNRRAFALSRHDLTTDGLVPIPPIFRSNSQDAWIWKSPLTAADDLWLQSVDFKIGKAGCDNRFAHCLRACALHVSNPLFQIVLHHVHQTPTRSYVPHGHDHIPGPYASVDPVLFVSK